MRSKLLDLSKYDTDKIPNGYLDRYDPVLQSLVDQEITLLELGVYHGGSLFLWRDYFPRSTVVGVDLQRPAEWREQERIHFFEGSQSDTTFLSKVAEQVAPRGFDIIIDDASHIGRLTKVSFWHLFDNHLKPGGLFVIEDWGTGYWDDWPDGRTYREPTRWQSRFLRLFQKLNLVRESGDSYNHSFGMVGFVKELVDEQGASDLDYGNNRNAPRRVSKFASLRIVPSLVFVEKAR
jgi:SAM-dependent methyltransferase